MNKRTNRFTLKTGWLLSSLAIAVQLSGCASIGKGAAEAVLENVNVNALAPMCAARAFAAQGRPGAIVNMLDALVADYDRKHVPYHLAKRMLLTLTSIMAVEFAPLVLLGAILPALRYWRSRRLARLPKSGRCLQCGYDLRASPHRCPECGSPNSVSTSVGLK